MQKLENFFISSKDSRIENPRSFYGCFYLGPFKPSQSLTIANALRRTLLSEIRGIAISSVYVEGADHEYSTLPGVKDSVLDILLNLKDIVLTQIPSGQKNHSLPLEKSKVPLSPLGNNLGSSQDNGESSISFDKPILGYLQVRGPGKIYASDLKLPKNIQCVDSTQYIATLSQNGALNIKFLISEGSAYQIQTPKDIQEFILRNENDITINSTKSKSPVFFNHLTSMFPLTLDPAFTPINKVNYTIEMEEPGPEYSMLKESVDLEKEIAFGVLPLKGKEQKTHIIIFEVWTNGSIHPREALDQAIQHLLLLFSNLSEMSLIQSSMAISIKQSKKNIQKMVSTIEKKYNF